MINLYIKLLYFISIFFVLYKLNIQFYYLFYFALLVIYGVSFFFILFFFDMSNISKNGVFTKDSNIVDFDIYWNIENIFIEQEKQKLVDFLKK